MHFPGLEKSGVLGKVAEVMEKLRNFVFWSKYFVLFENWKHSPCQQANICPQKAGVSVFVSHGKFELVMEKSLNFIVQNMCESSRSLRGSFCCWFCVLFVAVLYHGLLALFVLFFSILCFFALTFCNAAFCTFHVMLQFNFLYFVLWI